MNRKITLLALAVKCGCFGAIGFARRLWPSAATACRARKPSRESIAVSATDAKPPPVSQRNSRRVRRQNWRWEGLEELLFVIAVSKSKSWRAAEGRKSLD